MPQPNSPVEPLTFPVAERFVSINGEGPYAGELAAFVRFTGCNLACSYCDTAWANEPDAPAEFLSSADIRRFVQDAGVRRVTLTGGEPLLQPGIDALLGHLLCEGGLAVEVETNGAVSIQQALSCADAGECLAITMDCKLPSSGMHGFMREENYALLRPCDTVKFVIGDEGDFPVVLDTVRRHNLLSRCHVHLSPVFGQMEAARIVEFMRDAKLNGATLRPQLHKWVWPGVEKGV